MPLTAAPDKPPHPFGGEGCVLASALSTLLFFPLRRCAAHSVPRLLSLTPVSLKAQLLAVEIAFPPPELTDMRKGALPGLARP